jgi:hypothetical protein
VVGPGMGSRVSNSEFIRTEFCRELTASLQMLVLARTAITIFVGSMMAATTACATLSSVLRKRAREINLEVAT